MQKELNQLGIRHLPSLGGFEGLLRLVDLNAPTLDRIAERFRKKPPKSVPRKEVLGAFAGD